MADKKSAAQQVGKVSKTARAAGGLKQKEKPSNMVRVMVAGPNGNRFEWIRKSDWEAITKRMQEAPYQGRKAPIIKSKGGVLPSKGKGCTLTLDIVDELSTS